MPKAERHQVRYERPRPVTRICGTCANLAHRVEGKRCKSCGLKRELEHEQIAAPDGRGQWKWMGVE